MLAFSDHGEQQEPEGTASYTKGRGQHAGPERPGVGRGRQLTEARAWWVLPWCQLFDYNLKSYA